MPRYSILITALIFTLLTNTQGSTIPSDAVLKLIKQTSISDNHKKHGAIILLKDAQYVVSNDKKSGSSRF